MFFRFFETRLNPFQGNPTVMPPDDLWAFYRFFLKQVWGMFALLLIVGLFTTVIEVSLFTFIGRIVDLAQHTPPQEFFHQHRKLLWLMVVVALVLRPIFLLLHNLLIQQTINPNVTNLIRWQSHLYVLRQNISFFQNDFAGRIASRIMQVGPSLRESAVQLTDSIWHVLIYTASALWLFSQADWRLMMPLIIWLGFYLAGVRYFIPKLKKRASISSTARSKLMGRIVDGYTNITTLKLFAHRQAEEDYVKASMTEHTARYQAMSRVITGMDSWLSLINGLLIVCTLGVAIDLWSEGRTSLGVVALAAGLVIRINELSTWIMWVMNGIFDNVGQVQDAIQSISHPLSLTDEPHAQPLQVTQGEIRLEHVNFHYRTAPPRKIIGASSWLKSPEKTNEPLAPLSPNAGVIHDLSLHIRAGEKIGLVGPSGAGKSTLVNLLLRLYDIEAGHILIDGQNIATVTQDSLRAEIGLVTQDTSLLHRSIRDNLLYGKPDATPEEVEHAIQRARADGFIPALSDAEGRQGLDAHVGERGVKLSGGQRQRIAIARVLLKNAPILILDEATSALDSEIEAAIQDSLELLMEGKTVIAIAHRLSTIAQMDRLVVLDQGQIIETGSHAELLAQGGLYARLWQHQTGGFMGID